MKTAVKQQKRLLRQRRVRAKVLGSKERPRLAVFRSNKHIYVQIIDDVRHVTILSLADTDMQKTSPAGGAPTRRKNGVEGAKELGKLLAKSAKDAKIGKVVFDRRGYAYHGMIKAVAEGAREGGLEF